MSEHRLKRYGGVMSVCGLAGLVAGGVTGFITAMSDEASPASAALIALAIALVAGALDLQHLRLVRGEPTLIRVCPVRRVSPRHSSAAAMHSSQVSTLTNSPGVPIFLSAAS